MIHLSSQHVSFFSFCRKEVTKPRNRLKEFLFNLFFFIIIPFLPIYKLFKWILRRCNTSEKHSHALEGQQSKSECKEAREGDRDFKDDKNGNPFAIGRHSLNDTEREYGDKGRDEPLNRNHSGENQKQSTKSDGDRNKFTESKDGVNDKDEFVGSTYDDGENEGIRNVTTEVNEVSYQKATKLSFLGIEQNKQEFLP